MESLSSADSPRARRFIDGARLKCIRCGAQHEGEPKLFACPKCSGLLEVVLEKLEWRPRGRGVWRYASALPAPPIPPVTMGEGGTPLVRSRESGSLYFKLEGLNPTGSFKDRGVSVATTVALYSGAKCLVCASTGNTSASVAAYAARAGMRAAVVLPRGKVARGKLLQALGYGARVVWVDGSFDEAIKLVREVVSMSGDLYPMNSFNPWRLEGQKTVVFEIFEELGRVDAVVYPVGNGGNISAGWKAAEELMTMGLIDDPPRLIGVQAAGAAPIADAFERGLSEPVFYDKPETVATAIRIGRPVNWPKVFRAIAKSGGAVLKVSDEEILRAQRELARREGILVEPASASTYAGYQRALETGVLDRDEVVVLVLTGNALKDPSSIELMSSEEIQLTRGATARELLEALLR
ncbi:MAG: threonine synthase [Fervidicoccaceae archaeon]